MKFGIQNSVIAWDDPWHRRSCRTMMRTGEGAWFPSQDTPPSKYEFLDCITRDLGVDLYVHHVMPDHAEIRTLIDDLENYGIDYILANEFGNANQRYTKGTDRYDVPLDLVRRAKRSARFSGLLYDETEHLQLNNLIYQKDPSLFQWTDPNGLSVGEMEETLVKSVRKMVDEYGCPLYGEVLFGTLYHAFSRGGMQLSAKAVKELYQPLQFSVALGAVREYRMPFSVTVDLWGPDVGEWFTRLWGFPGHSPQEFRSGLEMAYFMSPDQLFVENCDPLLRHEKAFELTEFGEIYRDFIRAHGKTLPYSAKDCVAEIAVIRSEDGVFAERGTFYGKGLYGADSPMPDERSCSFFQVMHFLSHGAFPKNGTTPYLTDNDRFPCANYPRDAETLKKFPLPQGVRGQTTHTLFAPLNNTLVFDSFADYDCLRESVLIVVCGSRLSKQCAEAVIRRAEEGARVIAADWFKNELKCPKIEFVSDFSGTAFQCAAERFRGPKDEWRVRFGAYQLTITDPLKDGISLRFQLERRLEHDPIL